jgi:hypothetical protein
MTGPRDAPDPERRPEAADLWAVLVLVAAGVAFFYDFLFTSKNFYFRDTLNFHYPLRRVLVDAWARGEFPLWNPFLDLGQPMLANPNYMAFYPTNLLHLVAPFNYAFKLHFVIHPLLAGLGLYFLERRLAIGALAAFGGALVYQFSGTVLSFLNLYNIVPVVALLPWLGWAFVGALRSAGWWRPTAAFGALLGLQVIALEPVTFQCDALLLGGLAVYTLAATRGRGAAVWRIVRTGVIGGACGLALAAVQLLPTLELMPLSARGLGYDYATVTGWSLHPIDLINTMVPNLFGTFYTVNNANYWGESFHGTREPYLVSYFMGAATMLLALLGLASGRRRLVGVVVLLSGVSLVLACGQYNPAFRWLFEHVSLFRIGRYPSKYFLLATLGIAVLAALGLDVVLRPEEGRRRRRAIVLVAGSGVLLGVLLIGAAGFAGLRPGSVEGVLRGFVPPPLVASKDFGAIERQLIVSVRSSGAFLVVASLLAWVAPFWRRSWLLGTLLVVVAAAELVPPNLRLSPLISDADVSFVPEVNAFIPQKGPPEPFRVASPGLLDKIPDLRLRLPSTSAAWLTLFYRMSGQPLYGIMQGIQYSINFSIDFLSTRESYELWRRCAQSPRGECLGLLQRVNTPMVVSLAEIDDPRLRLLRTFETRSDFDARLYWMDGTLPRAFFASGVRRARSPGEALREFLDPAFPYGNTVVLEEGDAVPIAGRPAAGSVRMLRYENQRVVCEVTADVPGHLVLLDSFYPGWRAYRDGREVPVRRADFAFRAVAVEAGTHTVEFRYQPRRFYLGLLISATALAAVALVAFRAGR